MEEAENKGLGTDIRQTKGFLLGSISSGHGVFHWYIQSFWVILPSLAKDMALSPVQVGSLITMRELVSGLIGLPAGLVTDMLRRRWRIIMAGCIGLLGLAYSLLSLAPNYPLVLMAMLVVAIPSSVWHLPAMTALSQHFTQRRGLALALHGVGGNIGDAIGPVVTGFLLVVLIWRQVFQVYALPALLLAFVAWWALRHVGGKQEVVERRSDFFSQLRTARDMLSNLSLIGLVAVAGFRSAGQIAFLTFLPLYLTDILKMDPPQVGFHIGLLVFLGMFSGPLLGFLSDRWGRKTVLVPSLTVLGLLALALVIAESGYLLTLVIAGMGIFLYSLQAIIMATAMDIAGKGVEATTLGFLFTSRFLFSAASPPIAGAIYSYISVQAAFYYIGALFLLSALTVAVLPLTKSIPMETPL